MQTSSDLQNPILSQKLRMATAEVHKKAEGSQFIKRLFQGTVSAQEYYLYLWSLLGLYTALEKAISFSRDTEEAVALIHFEELERTLVLKSDLADWSHGKIEIPASVRNAVTEYADYLNYLAENSPHLLVSHAYVRYLGDLSGGQMLSKILSRRFPESKGLSFYSFPIQDVNTTKTTYRAALDIVGQLHADDHEAFCHEAIRAFEFNDKIFRALDEVLAPITSASSS